MRPVLWTIGGVDPSGGAGVLADVRVAEALGVHAAAVVTATTAQGLASWGGMHAVAPEVVRAQLEMLGESLRPRAVKVGMLGSADVAAVVAEFLDRDEWRDVFVVVDPVAKATAAGDEDAVRWSEALWARADLLTPNLLEASDVRTRAVLVKGGHGGDDVVRDVYRDERIAFSIASPRVKGRDVRGTGCALATAIAALVARGEEVADAIVEARAFIAAGIREAHAVVSDGPDVLAAGARVTAVDFPWIERGDGKRVVFPSTGPAPLGFYPIVDRAAWIPRLVAAGATTIQLRVKDLSGEALVREVKAAVAAASNLRLFINDFWRLALDCGAYGVHLGQEDLDGADLVALAAAGVRLGVSTHAPFELARAMAVRPSYVALGPIFPTTCKSMRFGPQGLARLADWRARVGDVPLVAIGGLRPEHVHEARRRGAEGFAVISDVLQAEDPDARARQWVAAGVSSGA